MPPTNLVQATATEPVPVAPLPLGEEGITDSAAGASLPSPIGRGAGGEGLCSRATANNRSLRQRIVVLVVFALGTVLAGRLVQLQILQRSALAARANRQRLEVELLPAAAGDLLDRHGRVLATTIKVRSLFAIPRNVSNAKDAAGLVSRALGLDADRLAARLDAARDKSFLWIKRRLTRAEEEAVRKLRLPADAWSFRDECLRQYPQGMLAAHVLGLRDIDGHGHGGLEESLEAILAGQDGRRTLIHDARNRVIDVDDEHDSPPRRGTNVTTTLDSVLQLYLERELDRLVESWQPHGACAIVEDPRSGEILAMASRPTFDPNHPEVANPEAWKNRAVAWMYEPGSTFKPFVVAGALAQGVLSRDEEIDCGSGELRLGSRVLHDVHGYGLLNVTDVLVKSSNIGMSRIGGRLSDEQLYSALADFGFGRPTGAAFPGELCGLFRPVKEWSSYSSASLSMGQELAVTPLQMIAAHAALANGGTLISPKLILSIAGSGSRLVAGMGALTPVVSKATDHDVARWLVTGPMTEVVRRGTGTRAQLHGYTVFGKTGTAQKLDPATGTYSPTGYVSSFLCGAPSANPRVLVLVAVDEPTVGDSHFGGTVAAPTAAEILREALEHLNVPRDASPPHAQ